MVPMIWREAITRRGLLGKLAALSTLLLFRRPVQGEPEFDIAPDPPPVYTLEERLLPILAGRTPRHERVTLTLPLHAEDGGTVPLQLDVESPMADADSRTEGLRDCRPESRPVGFLRKPSSRHRTGAVETQRAIGRQLSGAGDCGNEQRRPVRARGRSRSAGRRMRMTAPVAERRRIPDRHVEDR